MTPHATVAQMVCDTLHLAPEDGLRAFWGLAVVLRAKLSPAERQGLAWAALMACDDDEAAEIADTVLPSQSRAGMPLPPLMGPLDEAAFWAGLASREELRACLLASFNALPPADQAEFQGFIARSAAA